MGRELCSVSDRDRFVVQLLSRVPLFTASWTAAGHAPPFTVSRSLLRLKSIESMMPSNHLILCWPFLLLPSIFPGIRVFFSPMSQFFASGGQSWRSSSSHSPSNEYSGLMSFWIDWFNFLADQDGDRSLPPGEIICKWGSERLFLPFVVMKEIGLYHPQWVKVSKKQPETWIKQATRSSSSSGLENSYLNRLN